MFIPKLMRKSCLTIIALLVFEVSYAVNPDPARENQTDFNSQFYGDAYEEIVAMIDGKAEVDLKRAVFLLEWAYLEGKPDYKTFCDSISSIAQTLNDFITLNKLDKHPIGKNLALFEYFTNPSPLNGFKNYIYDFKDFHGYEDFTKTFVTKLMRTHSGQCRSLPLMYKILANEIGAEAWIAYAPNHLFIRHRNENGGWSNVELTNQSLPREVFIIENMGITQQAIDKGTYMKPCEDSEVILQLLVELTDGYSRRLGLTRFIPMCVEKVLRHNPNHLYALMTKYNYMYAVGVEYQESLIKRGLPMDAILTLHIAQFEAVNQAIDDTGHVEMSPEIYDRWIRSMQDEIERRKSQNNNN